MKSDLFQRVDRSFQAVLAARADGVTEPALTALCDGDPAAIAEVRSLLVHVEIPSSGNASASPPTTRVAHAFLDPAELHRRRGSDALLADAQSRDAGGALLNEWGASAAGQRVGDFTLIAPIGTGGMGVVFVAEQERPRRTVALKLVRRAAATPTLVLRFEREAQLLGRLNHPGIAQIYAAGVAELESAQPTTAHATPIRVPFLAMELVHGPNVLAYVRQRACEPATKHIWHRIALEVIAQVCDAVGHAHQRGVIHRDLKPANILVAAGDNGTVQVKVLDFGIARDVTSDQNPAHTITFHSELQLTSPGHLIGTLAYMSPEQLRGGAGLDTRCDVYALGVMLFEMLAGRLPHEVNNCPLPEVARRIVDDQPPKLSTLDRCFRGDIETIVAKALEKDASRRYASCADLARDLQHYLAGEPIEARRDSVAYIWRRQAARYRTLLFAAAIMLVMTIAAALYARSQQQREATIAQAALNARDEADTARRDATAANLRLADELVASHIEQGRLLGVSGDGPGAERILWDADVERPHSTATRWALRELYARTGRARSFKLEQATVRALAILPNATRQFVSGCERGGRLSVWSIDRVEPIDTIDTSLDSVHALASLDATHVVAAGLDGSVVVDLVGRTCRPIGAPVETWTVDVAPASATASAVLALGSADGIVRLIDGNDGRALATLSPGQRDAARPEIIRGVSFDRAGRQLAVAVDNEPLRLWSLHRDEAGVLHVQPGMKLQEQPDARLSAVAFSNDGQIVAAGGPDHMLHLWRTDDGRCISAIKTNNGTCRSIDASPDGKFFAVSGFYGTRLFDTHTGARTAVPGVPLLGIAPDGDFVARFAGAGINLITAGSIGQGHIWCLSPIKSLSEPEENTVSSATTRPSPAAVRDMAIVYVGDRALVAAVQGNGRLTLRESTLEDARRPEAWHVRWTRNGADEGVSASSVAISADGATVSVGRADGHVITVRAEDGQVLSDLAAHSGPITGLRAVPGHENAMITGGVDASVAFWNRSGPDGAWRLARRLACDGEVIGLAIRPSADAVAVTQRPNTLSWFALPSGVKIGGRSETSTAWHPTISPDGQRLAIGAWDRGIRLWTLPGLLNATSSVEGKQGSLNAASDANLVGHTQMAIQEAFDANGTPRLASVSNDGTLRVWDVERKASQRDGSAARPLLATFDPEAGDATAVVSLALRHSAADRDAPVMISGHGDGRLRLWDWHQIDQYIDDKRAELLRARQAAAQAEAANRWPSTAPSDPQHP